MKTDTSISALRGKDSGRFGHVLTLTSLCEVARSLGFLSWALAKVLE